MSKVRDGMMFFEEKPRFDYSVQQISKVFTYSPDLEWRILLLEQ